MYAIQTDSDWNLYDPNNTKKIASTVRAKDLWKKILTSYFESGSPFLCFKDTANRANPNNHTGKIRSSNLCTEIFQNTEPDHYMTKLWVNGGTEYVLFEEDDMVELQDGNMKVAKKITSLDTLADCAYMTNLGNSTDNRPGEPIAEVYNVEKERIAGTTAVCNLASVNLSKINTNEDLARVIPTAVRMLDNVIDLNFYPLKKVKDSNMNTRSIGLGVMGEAQMLAENQIMFGSQKHLDKIDKVMEVFSYETINASANLAIERGAYPDFKGSQWSKGTFPFDHANEEVFKLTTIDTSSEPEWSALANKIKSTGVRNGYMMAIAPTSSISILVGTTQAIEPVYKRKWFEENLSGQIPVVVPNLSPETWAYYVPAFEVNQLDIVKAASVRQKWIDQGQSTNIFMSLDKASGKYLHEIYTLAHKLGCKSTYYLRSQSPEAASDVADRSQECSGCQ